MHSLQVRQGVAQHRGVTVVHAHLGNAVHGHGGGKDLKASRQERFHRRIDEGLTTTIDRARPLVLAGVGSAVASFRSVSHHPHVVDEFVNGNPDHVSADELRRAAWPIVRSAVEAERHELVTAARTGRRPIAATSEEAGRMAATGRVVKLPLPRT